MRASGHWHLKSTSRSRPQPRADRGVTLVEVLVTVAVLAMVAAVAMPSVRLSDPRLWI
jgi:prepilin-type N-terminal cleavage/methylation domain-containing protein